MTPWEKNDTGERYHPLHTFLLSVADTLNIMEILNVSFRDRRKRMQEFFSISFVIDPLGYVLIHQTRQRL